MSGDGITDEGDARRAAARRRERARLARGSRTPAPGAEPDDGRRQAPSLDPKVRAHVLTTAFIALALLAITLLLTRPAVLLWLLGAAAAVMLYAALHLAITRRLAEDDALESGDP